MTWIPLPKSEVRPPFAPAVDDLFDEMFAGGPYQTTYAALVVHRGAIVAERYAGELEHWDRPNEPVTADTPLLSWSMAKSFLHATVGLLVADGVLDVDAPADVPEWRAEPDDPRRAITLEQLLCMRDGLDFTEDYVDAGISDVIEMLFGAGKDDVGRFAADRPLRAEPGTAFNYSSGTSNIVSGIVRRALGGRDEYERFLHERLLGPIGIPPERVRLTFDAAGTWVASSFIYLPARDFARFGLLYLHDGVWDGRRILPEGWVDHGRRARSVDPGDGRVYGAHWWVLGDEHGTFWANGYEGQQVIVCPGLDLVIVRLGKTPADDKPWLMDWHRKIIGVVAGSG